VTDLLQLTFSGLSLGAAYALIALGFVVIYRSSQIFNFAHGEFLTVGAFSMTTMLSLGLPWPLSLLAAMAITGAVAAGVERAVVRPMIGRPVFVTIILTIFVAYLLRAGIVIVWGTEMRGIATPWDSMGSVEIFGATVLYNWIGSVVAGAAALILFFLLLKYTRLGIGMRAASFDQEMAMALGVPVGHIFRSTWFLAGMYAALAGVFLSLFPKPGFDSTLGFVAFRAFPAIIVGGLTSPVGTVIAGLLLGLTEVMAQAYVQPALAKLPFWQPYLKDFGLNIHLVFPYIIMILFLMVRPYGILGRREVERV
jgi:branched-chain amino acid transport system permease protein